MGIDSQNKNGKVDKYMAGYLTDNLKWIRSRLLAKFPDRRKALKSAFAAHNRRDYYSSIPILLSQAEGICIELTGLKLYGTIKGKPVISKFVKELPEGGMASILLQPLLSQGLITATEGIRNKFPGTFDRYGILHGLSTDYGTRLDSLRAISWINYIAEVLLLGAKKKETANSL